MGAWAYCRTCDRGLDKPTARQVVEGVQECSQGHGNDPCMTRDELLIDLDERVRALEEKLGVES